MEWTKDLVKDIRYAYEKLNGKNTKADNHVKRQPVKQPIKNKRKFLPKKRSIIGSTWEETGDL